MSDYDTLSEIGRLRAQVAKARNDALEEAITVLRRAAPSIQNDPDGSRVTWARDAFETAIEALQHLKTP